MKSRRRWQGRLFFALAVVLLGVGGGQSALAPSPSPSNSNTADMGTPLLTFTWYNNNDVFAPASWGSNAVSQWVEQNKRVHVNWILAAGSAKQKLNAMLVSGDLPDVMNLNRGRDVERLVQSGSLVPLDDFVDKYPNLKKYASELTLNMLRSSDGKLYQFPVWYSPPEKSKGNGGYMIEKKIYKSLGSPPLETFDDLVTYAKLVRQTYPEVVPIEVGAKFSGADVLFTGFGDNNSVRYLFTSGGLGGLGSFPAGDRLLPIYSHPDFRKYMLFVSELFRDQLLPQDGFTQTKDQYMEKLVKGKAAVVISGNIVNDGNLPNAILSAADPDDGYEVIWPLRDEGVDKNKVTVSSYDQLGSSVNVITAKAKDPEKIFAFLDWMTGMEGQRIFWYGPPGLLYDQIDEDGVPRPNDKFTNMTAEELGRLDIPYANMVGNTMYIDSSKVARDRMLPQEKRDFTIQAQAAITWRTSINMTEFVNLNPPPDSEEGAIAQRLRDIYSQYYTRIVFAGSDIEALSLLDEAASLSRQAGEERLLNYQTDKWRENRKLLGK